eukprot:scaffold54090_cov18-Prasinocladus_malaysianus.AAC.1
MDNTTMSSKDFFCARCVRQAVSLASTIRMKPSPFVSDAHYLPVNWLTYNTLYECNRRHHDKHVMQGCTHKHLWMKCQSLPDNDSGR